MEKDHFKLRFRKLYELSGCASITQFARDLDMNRQSVDRYYNGERCPDAPALAQICEKMNVSADWLLGLSEVRSTSSDINTCVQTMGISEDATMAIININPEQKSAFNRFIQHNEFQQMMKSYSEFTELLEQASKRFTPGTPGASIGIGMKSKTIINKDGSVTVQSIWDALTMIGHEIGFQAELITDSDRMTLWNREDDESKE